MNAHIAHPRSSVKSKNLQIFLYNFITKKFLLYINCPLFVFLQIGKFFICFCASGHEPIEIEPVSMFLPFTLSLNFTLGPFFARVRSFQQENPDNFLGLIFWSSDEVRSGQVRQSD